MLTIERPATGVDVSVGVGVLSNPQALLANERLTVRVSGGSATVQYSVSGAPNVQSDVASWHTWPPGEVTVDTAQNMTRPVFVRIQNVSGTVSYQVDPVTTVDTPATSAMVTPAAGTVVTLPISEAGDLALMGMEPDMLRERSYEKITLLVQTEHSGETELEQPPILKVGLDDGAGSLNERNEVGEMDNWDSSPVALFDEVDGLTFWQRPQVVTARVAPTLFNQESAADMGSVIGIELGSLNNATPSGWLALTPAFNCMQLVFRGNDAGDKASLHLRVWKGDAATAAIVVDDGTASHALNKWYRLTLVYKPGVNGYIRGYIDGVKAVEILADGAVTLVQEDCPASQAAGIVQTAMNTTAPTTVEGMYSLLRAYTPNLLEVV